MASLKIKAFSLFESVVAIAIISACIGIGTLIYGNIIDSEDPVLAIEGQEEIHTLFENLKASKQYLNEHFDYEYFSIDQSLSPYRGAKHLLHVNYKVYSGSEIVVEQNYLIFNEEMND